VEATHDELLVEIVLIYKCTCADMSGFNKGQHQTQITMVDNWTRLDNNGVKAGSSLYKSQLLTFFRITSDFLK